MNVVTQERWRARPDRSADPWGHWIAHALCSVNRSAQETAFDDDSRLVFFSDCHRGTRGRLDAFAVNAPLFIAALSYYDRQGFIYVEVGDGDELWQNRRLLDIRRAHRPAFDLLSRFQHQQRLHIIQGNHDVAGGRRQLQDKAGIPVTSALALRHRRTNQRILVTHGHQADVLSSWLSPLSRALVRHVWRRLCRWQGATHIHQRSREERTRELERRLMAWTDTWQQPLICGHTHRAKIAEYDDAPYFNTGCWTKPGVATGLEIQGGEISLVRWAAHPISHHIWRERIALPRKLSCFAQGIQAEFPTLRTEPAPAGCA